MKTLPGIMVNRRLVQVGGLLAIMTILAASIVWSNAPDARIKLRGAWIAQVDNGARAVVTYGATDPSGQSSVFRAQMVWPPAMLASLGLDAVTDEIGEEFVTGKNTSQYTAICYGLAGGQIALIILDNTIITHLSPTELALEHTISFYQASADTNNDGYPELAPFMTVTAKSLSKRVAH
jgi:hypothetical protein